MRLLATQNGIENLHVPAAGAAADQERRSWLKRLGAAIGLGMLGGPALAAPQGTRSIMGADPYIGEIMIFAGNFAINGWAMCNGQLLSIAQNTALFSILGTTYGGNGQTTFALPNLMGRFPMHYGTGAGLSPRSLGEMSGTENVTLLSTQMPAHTHSMNVSSAAATAASPVGGFIAMPNGITAGTEESVAINSFGTPANGTANPAAIGVAGGSQPHSVMNPYLALNFQIALQGIYPSRS